MKKMFMIKVNYLIVKKELKKTMIIEDKDL